MGRSERPVSLWRYLETRAVKLLSALHINRESRIWSAVRIVCTFCLIDLAWLFFRAPSFLTGVAMIHRAVTCFSFESLFLTGADGSLGLYTLGLDVAEFWLAVVCILILAIADIVKEKRPIRPMITRLPLVPALDSVLCVPVCDSDFRRHTVPDLTLRRSSIFSSKEAAP